MSAVREKAAPPAAVSLEVRTASGGAAGHVEGDGSWFGIAPNGPVMHQVVVAQLAARRAGTQSTKTRAENARSKHKSRRQKGGGTSRQGSMSAPQWVGGGVALGPKPRSYAQRTPKKMINLALRSALSDRAAAGKVLVLDGWGLAAPKTKEAVRTLHSLGLADRKVLVVLNPSDDAEVIAAKSLQNLPLVQVIAAGELNAYDVLCSDVVLFTKSTVPGAGASGESEAKESGA